MKALHIIAFILVIVGGLNWLLVGLFGNFDLVAYLFTELTDWPIVANLVYILVGLSAIVLLFTHKKDCTVCNTGSKRMADAQSVI